jgi:hypothetical protein
METIGVALQQVKSQVDEMACVSDIELESRMRETRPSGLAGAEAGTNRPSLPRVSGKTFLP